MKEKPIKDDDYARQQDTQLVEGIIEHVQFWDKENKKREAAGRKTKKLK